MNQPTDFALRRRRHALQKVISRVEREIDSLDLSDNCGPDARTRIDFLGKAKTEARSQINEIDKKLDMSEEAKRFVDDLVSELLN